MYDVRTKYIAEARDIREKMFWQKFIEAMRKRREKVSRDLELGSTWEKVLRLQGQVESIDWALSLPDHLIKEWEAGLIAEATPEH